MKYMLPNVVRFRHMVRGNLVARTVREHHGTRGGPQIQVEGLLRLSTHLHPRYRNDNCVSKDERAARQDGYCGKALISAQWILYTVNERHDIRLQGVRE